MKKFGIFAGGFATGVVLTFVVLLLIATVKELSSADGVNNFEQPTEIVQSDSYEVFQVVSDNAALVNGPEFLYDDVIMYTGPVYLIRNYENKYYYDDEIIEVKRGQHVVQTGTYRYKTTSGNYKTVPIIEIVK